MQANIKFLEDIIKREKQEVRKFFNLPPDQQKLVKGIEPFMIKLKTYPISFGVFLIANQFFSLLARFQIKSGSVFKKNVLYMVGVCEFYNKQFFELDKQKHKKIINQWKENKEQWEVVKKLVDKQMQNEQKNKAKQEGLKKFLDCTLKIIKLNKDCKQLKQAINQAFIIKRQEQKQDAQAFFQHGCNYLRSILDSIRKKTNPSLICCKPIFFEKQQISSIEGPCQQFKRYTWPITNVSIKNHIIKTIVGFMNSKGGIIYIGIMQNKDKKNEVVGINLKPTEVKQIQAFIIDIVSTIFPKHEQFQVMNEIKQKVSSNCKEFIINNYVKMQFIPIVSKQTYCNMHQKNQKGEIIVSSSYIVKLIVKIGHPKHLYHVVNVDKNIDFYERQDRNVDKKPFTDAYKQIYERLDRFERAKKSGFKKEIDRQLFHNYCRYSMDVKLQLKSDKQSSSDDNDDDNSVQMF